MGDEGDEMQIAVFVVAPSDLEDVYFNDAIGV
jgi:hypothetical protein